jgi:hypothetical protein
MNIRISKPFEIMMCFYIIRRINERKSYKRKETPPKSSPRGGLEKPHPKSLSKGERLKNYLSFGEGRG